MSVKENFWRIMVMYKKITKINILLVCFLTFLSMFIIGEANAASYYISPNGTDSGNCFLAAPCKTIKTASSKLAAGDTLYARGGTYITDNDIFAPGVAGTAVAPITIRNYPGETPIFSGNNNQYWTGIVVYYASNGYLVFDGLEFTGFRGFSLQLDNASNIKVRNCYFHDSWAQGVGAVSVKRQDGLFSENFLIENNIFENIGGAPTQPHMIYVDEGIAFVTIRNNYFKNTVLGGDKQAGSSIHIYSGVTPRPHDVNIYNNVFYLTTGTQRIAILAYTFTDEIHHVTVYNNTIYLDCQGTTVCRAFDMRTYGTDNIVKNNITYFVNKGDPNDIILTYGPSYVTFNYNLYYPSKDSDDTGSHSFSGDPLFVDVVNADLRLKPGSPAINVGATLSSVTTDYDGISRPQRGAYDIGAYEYVGAQVADTTPPSAPTGLTVL